MPAAHGFTRDRATVACYVLLALLTSSYGMVGPVMPFLRADLGLSYQQGAYHAVAMAIGTVATGLAGPMLLERIGRAGCIRAMLAASTLGAILLCSAQMIVMSLAGGAFFGAAIALAVLVCPAVFSEKHGRMAGIALSEANFIGYLGIFIIPGVVSLTSSLAGWRWSFVLPVACYLVFAYVTPAIDFGTAKPRTAMADGSTLPFAYWCFWSFLTFAVSAEFCMVVWGASYLESAGGLSRDLALWASMIFPAGMLVGRLFGALLMRRFPVQYQALPTLVIAAGGAAMFISAEQSTMRMAGLFVSGLGIANLYPIGITLAMLAAGEARDAASARASLASGLASLVSPLLLGAIADRAGMKSAFGAVFVFLVLAAVAAILGMRRRA